MKTSSNNSTMASASRSVARPVVTECCDPSVAIDAEVVRPAGDVLGQLRLAAQHVEDVRVLGAIVEYRRVTSSHRLRPLRRRDRVLEHRVVQPPLPDQRPPVARNSVTDTAVPAAGALSITRSAPCARA